MCDYIVTMPKATVLIVDDDRPFAAKLSAALDGVFTVRSCHSEPEFEKVFATGKFDLLILDMRLSEEKEGLALLKKILEHDPQQAAIIMTAYADMESYAEALEAGALTYLNKNEFSPNLIARTVEAIVEQAQLRRSTAALQARIDIAEPIEIVGASPGIVMAREMIRSAAGDSDCPVIVIGENGTGRELIARNIHRHNRKRSSGPFVIGSSASASSSVTFELFGKVSENRMGRAHEKNGWIDEARSGVLVLRDAADLPREAVDQMHLVVTSRSFVRAAHRVEADVQAIFLLRDSSLSEEPIQRLRRAILEECNGIEIELPPLKERAVDIPLIAQYRLQNLYRAGRTRARSLTADAMAQLESLSWPGNVRELNAAIEYAAIVADAVGARNIAPEHLPLSTTETPYAPAHVTTYLDYQLNLGRAELQLIETAIERFGLTRKSDLAIKLRYNDRFTFSRRVQRQLGAHSQLAREFPRVAELFAYRRRNT